MTWDAIASFSGPLPRVSGWSFHRSRIAASGLAWAKAKPFAMARPNRSRTSFRSAIVFRVAANPPPQMPAVWGTGNGVSWIPESSTIAYWVSQRASASTWPLLMALICWAPAPIGTRPAAFSLIPLSSIAVRANVPPELATAVTPIFLPFRSATLRTAEPWGSCRL
ncbi:hypothetical protein GCM10020001_039810 [Nonomuraea salmonea]